MKINMTNFIETSQVTELRQAIKDAMAAGVGKPNIVMPYGPAGTGKTWAARKLYVELGGYYLRVLEGMSQHAFLQELCREITGTEPSRSIQCKKAIIAKLEEDPKPIFIDEIERMPVGRLEDMRDIADITGAPPVFVGEMVLLSRVAARERINDRIPQAFRIMFNEIKAKDIMVYAMKAADLTLTPEAGAVVCDCTNGNFRRVDNAVFSLKKAAKAAGTKKISADMARQVLKGKAA